MYKKIKMTKLYQVTGIDFKDINLVLKKNVMKGEINIKYDEVEDIIEVFNVDPGLNERVERTKENYKELLEGNKNLFITIKTKTLGKLAQRAEMMGMSGEIIPEGMEMDFE